MGNEVTSAPPSRREAHKLRTERALQWAALELFADQGFDETTTDEIAEQAGVSPRTFFRYFPTKESVLFVGEYRWFESFTEHYLAQPESATDLEAARATLLALAPELAKRRRSLLLYEKAIASSATLRGGVQTRLQDDIAHMAQSIATRRGMKKPDESCALFAHVLLVTYRRAVFRWLAGRAATSPADVIDDELDLLTAAFTPV